MSVFAVTEAADFPYRRREVKDLGGVKIFHQIKSRTTKKKIGHSEPAEESGAEYDYRAVRHNRSTSGCHPELVEGSLMYKGTHTNRQQALVGAAAHTNRVILERSEESCNCKCGLFLK
jgi:hypothetical protein